MSKELEQLQREIIEELRKRVVSHDDKIAFFPYGGDRHDFSDENAEKFLLSVITRTWRASEEAIWNEQEKQWMPDFHHRTRNKIEDVRDGKVNVDSALKSIKEYIRLIFLRHRAVEGAEKAMKEFGNVFKRLKDQ